MTIKPLLAAKADISKIKYPCLATPKLDGIRCLIVDGKAMSRTMKPIPNEYIQAKISELSKSLESLEGCDGELMVDGDYNDVQSAVMSRSGEPNFRFHVFDKISQKPYKERLLDVEQVCSKSQLLVPVLPTVIDTEEDLFMAHAHWLDEGYEGTMIRCPEGPYKHGRSTVKQGILLKLKDFDDDEATIWAIHEKMHNTSEAEKDELGYTKRSQKKDNKSPAGTAGKVTLMWKGMEVSAGFGLGIDDAYKQHMWDNQEEYIGKTYKFQYQGLSKDGVPRFPKIIGERSSEDIDEDLQTDIIQDLYRNCQHLMRSHIALEERVSNLEKNT